MNNEELISKVRSSMYRQCRERGYATAVDVLMDTGILPKQKYEDWRYGRVPNLEAVCQTNLSKLTLVRRAMRKYAEENNLKASFTYYKRWGVKKKGSRVTIPLRFSKSGNPEIEKQYATHYIDPTRSKELQESRRRETTEKQALSEQIKRISRYEELLEKAKMLLDETEAAGDTAVLDQYIRELDAYYGSDLWKQDFAADEAGLLPEDLKRGVLSEDGIYNALEEYKEMRSKNK